MVQLSRERAAAKARAQLEHARLADEEAALNGMDAVQKDPAKSGAAAMADFAAVLGDQDSLAEK